MKAIVYTAHGSSSSREVRKVLDRCKIDYVLKNIDTYAITEEEIKHFLERVRDFDELFAPRSIAFNKIKDNYKNMSTKEIMEYIRTNPRVLKIPIVYTKHHMMLGYEKDEFQNLVKTILTGKRHD